MFRWSYGILLWEIMTLGAIPYPEIRDYTKLYRKLMEGARMQQPPDCPDPMYVFLSCIVLIRLSHYTILTFFYKIIIPADIH